MYNDNEKVQCMHMKCVCNNFFFILQAKRRILLTGTPLQNNLLELMSLLIFLMPSIFAGKQNELKFLFSKNLVSTSILKFLIKLEYIMIN